MTLSPDSQPRSSVAFGRKRRRPTGETFRLTAAASGGCLRDDGDPRTGGQEMTSRE